MPASLQKHNLVRVREELRLTQSDLAALVGRSPSTIKYIETGHLLLSRKLAALIAEQTGADPEWLMRNDLSEPMPPLVKASSTYGPEEEEYRRVCGLLKILFHRFFSVLHRLKDGDGKKETVEYFVRLIDDHLNGDKPAKPFASQAAYMVPLDFFKKHPEKLDTDIRGLIDLDLLMHERLREISKQATIENAVEEALKQDADTINRLHLRIVGSVDSAPSDGKTAAPSQTRKRKRQKSPSQTPASPSPAGRRKNRASS
jgi:transcriptional regulator with XRE-family HTH domain